MSRQEAADALRDACARLCDYGRRLNRDGLAIGPAGNLSVRVGDTIAITPSQLPYDRVRPDDICLVGPDGRQYDGAGRPSSELPMHRAVYAATGAHAVVHTHSPRAVAISTVTDELPAVHYCVLRLGGPTVPVVPYHRFGSDELAEAAATALTDRTGAVLQNHGTIACADDLETAYERAQLIEFLAVVWSDAARLGVPRVLDANELAAVQAERQRRDYGTTGAVLR